MKKLSADDRSSISSGPIGPLPRREFLKAGASVVVAASLPQLTRAEPPRRLKAGFLGGAHSHAIGKWKCLSQSTDFELVGMADESPEVRAQFEALGARFVTPDTLVEECEIVIVESGVADHARQALFALEAKKHVHLEKPPSDNMQEFERVVEAARRNQLVLQLGYMWRHHPGMVKIFEAVANGWLGDVYLVRGTINNQLPAERRAEWAEFAGGSMFELGSHLIDATVRLLGKPTSVTPSLRTDGRPKDKLRDNNLVVLQFEQAQGVVSSATLQPNSGRHRIFEVLGTKGTATLCPIEPPKLEMDLAAAAGPYPKGVSLVPLPAYERYVGDLQALARAVRGEEPLAVDLDAELTIQRTVLQASGML